MTVKAGNVLYNLGQPPCSGVGLQWSNEDLDAALDNRVASVLFDDQGKVGIGDILAGLAETGFIKDGLDRLLRDPDRVESWRVGEAIAETYLADHRSCYFPWPDGRDERKRGSSLPGADLVGFGLDDNGDCFVFGEVKTSSEQNYPPGVMYSPTGLKRQLEVLRDDQSIRDDLVMYLAHRALSAPWRLRFKNAAVRYLHNSSDIHLFGYLVRDVKPHQDDLRAWVNVLGMGCPDGTHIELIALYLPKRVLDGIGERMILKRKGSG